MGIERTDTKRTSSGWKMGDGREKDRSGTQDSNRVTKDSTC